MKWTLISIFLIGALMIGGFFVGRSVNSTGGSSEEVDQESGSNVITESGKQIIEITAKGGYTPRVTTASSGVPTVIRVKTQGTFDCSSSLVIPSMNIRKTLPQNGETDIEIPAQQAGSSLQGLCSMGMYSFTVNFS